MPLPQEPFETGRVFTPRVDRYSQITVRTNRYSVPVRLIGKRVRVVLHASHLVVYDQNVEVARHERLIAKAGCRLELDHYLEALIRKPGAFPGATALEQARSAGKFTPVHDAWWAQTRKAHGERDGTRALIEVLLLARHIPHEHLVAGLATALRAGALTADAVALEARKTQPVHIALQGRRRVPGSRGLLRYPGCRLADVLLLVRVCGSVETESGGEQFLHRDEPVAVVVGHGPGQLAGLPAAQDRRTAHAAAASRWVSRLVLMTPYPPGRLTTA
ncbi:hypothetical protein ACGFZU_38845 [Streptomyces tendae]|uniref:Mu transposase domain-containing protein n=1 Tax=Streptomyces tendae TaxID=1932 RepID=UPI00371BFD85